MTRFPLMSPAPAPAAAPSPRRLALAALMLAAPFVVAGTAEAATIAVSSQSSTVGNAYDGDDSLCSLVGAIINANTDSQGGDPGCASGSGADTIVLPPNVAFNLTQTNHTNVGTNGLPGISSAITIEGNGSRILRFIGGGGTPAFRIFRVASNGQLTLNRVTIQFGRAGNGAGVLVQRGGGLTVNRSVFSTNNTSGGDGGALHVEEQANVTLNNSTLSGNFAFGIGGAIYSRGTTSLNQVTVTQNTASDIGGLAIEGGAITLSNSIVSGNGGLGDQPTVSADEIYVFDASAMFADNNLLGRSERTNQQSFFGIGPIYGNSRTATVDGTHPTALDSILNTTLASNGGPTQTHALVAGSPAINAANPLFTDSMPTVGSSLRRDQRGFVLASGDTRRDIGAFEFNGVSPAPTITALSPATGNAAGGTRVTITGTNFDGDSGPTVKFGTVSASGIARLSATTIEANSPAGTGTVNVTVTTDEGTSADNGTLDDFTYASAINGGCGPASADKPTATAPAEFLCTTGTATAVTGNSNGRWNWDCQGSGGGTSTTGFACSAPYASQSITLKASPASTTIGQEPANVSAMSDSGRPAALSTTTREVCTVGTPNGAGALVTAMVLGQTAGTCTVTATLAGTGDVGTFRYLAASDQTVDITVSKGVQKIIAFSADKTQLPVGGMTTLSAEGGASGNAVTFSSLSSEICFVSGSMVTALSAGSCTVAADQAGNDGFDAAAQATLDITVAKAAQLISGFTANPSALKVGGMATLSASGGASGNAIAFRTTTSEVCSVSGAMVTALSAGSCTLIASQAGNADFEAADEVSLTVAVNKAAQLISGFTANPSMIKVGQTSQLSAFGGASGKPIVFASTTSDVCSISGSTVTALAVGNCVVTANQAGNADFEAAEPAMLTIGIEAANVATAPVLALDMNDLDFGTGYLLRFRDIGVETTSEAEVVTVSNTGTAPLAISSIVTTGDFRHTTTCGVSVAPGATCTISIRFSPKAVGTRTGETRIVSNAVSSPDLIRLSGTGKGLQPAIKTNVSSFDFGRVRVGATSLDRTLVITSSGSGPLEIRSINVTGDYTGSHNCPRFLDAGKSCQVTGRFRPRATGVRPGAVSILTSVSSTPTQVTLTGTGTSGGTVN
ncbi:MAG: choice-of-anchor D domain-containing protein [Gammaproteobacteria bacterium]|nr:choice-of-anchor D domain-containing protein [Gammaproteobacteria bacterium]